MVFSCWPLIYIPATYVSTIIKKIMFRLSCLFKTEINRNLKTKKICLKQYYKDLNDKVLIATV